MSHILLIQFLFGLGSSVHCIGMCGPIQFALPLDKEIKFGLIADLLLYHLGRIFMYAMMGILVGQLGNLLQIQEIQSYLALLAGIVLLVYGLQKIIHLTLPSFLAFNNHRLLQWYNVLLRKKGKPVLLLLGMTNGLIPCGMVYAAMAIAFMNHHWLFGGALMVAFGLGTIPALIFSFMGMQQKNIKLWASRYNVQAWMMIAAGLFVCIKSTTMIMPPEAALWQSIVNPIMCHQ